MNRPISQVVEIKAISGNNLTLSTPLHMTFDVAHSAQVTPFTCNGSNTKPVSYAGLEDVYVAGAPDPGGASQYNNIVLTLAKYSWVKNVESDQSNGYSVGIDSALRCVVRDSYLHSTINPTPGGAGYGLEFSAGSADNLVENIISWNFNKVMVMRASGGGNVIAYSYMDDGWIAYQPNWPESGLDDGHMTTPHFELFEGNLTFSMGGDDTWGGAIFQTWLRNLSTGHRSAWPPLNTYTFDSNSQTTGCQSGGANDLHAFPTRTWARACQQGRSTATYFTNSSAMCSGIPACRMRPSRRASRMTIPAPTGTGIRSRCGGLVSAMAT